MEEKEKSNFFDLFEPVVVSRSKTHLAIFRQPYLDLILDGKKTIESRFALDRRAPYNSVRSGDKIIMKESGGLVKGEFTAGKVQYLELKSDGNGMRKCKSFSKEICSDKDPKFWDKREKKKFATLIEVKNPKRYDTPRECTEKPNRSMSAWFVLD